MARTTEADRVKTLEKRIRQANKLYDKWSDRYETKRLEDYYLGKQWSGLEEEEAKKRYVINLVYSSIEVNKPSLIFHNPQVRMQPRPERGNDLGSDADSRARLCQETVQTFIDDPDFGFADDTALALQEAHFRLGIIEVGYTSDSIANPEAGKPVLKEDDETPVRDGSGAEVLQPDRVVKSESLFIKRIPASSFRVSISSKNRVSRNDWVGYYEWHYVEDVKRSPAYKNTANLKATGTISKELRDESDVNPDDLERHHGMIKLWKVWDIRRKVRHVIAEGHPKFLQEDVSWKYLPFSIIKFHEILDSFYPLPPVFAWLGPQDEVNETRDMQRAHRRRFYRRYTYTEGSIEDTELQKLENGGDGVYAKSNVPNPLIPVPDAPLSADVWRHLDESKTDFIAVSAVGGEQRGVAESETATQASIIDVRARLRESAARTKVATWLAGIARLMLFTIRDNMALEFWVKRSVDPYSPNAPQEALKTATLWQQITADDLGDLDLDVFVDLASMSPITEDIQRNSWSQVLALLTNPALLAILSKSEVLLRKTLNLYGIRAENEIQEIMKVIQIVVAEMQMAAMAGAGSAGGRTAGSASVSSKSNSGGSTVTPDKLSAIMGAATQGGSVS